MLLNEILLSIREAIATSAEIEAFCREHFGQPLLVHIGADVNKLVEAERWPYVCIVPTEAEFKRQNMRLISNTVITVIVCLSSRNVASDGRGSIYDGLLQLNELSMLIRRAIMQLRSVPIGDAKFQLITEGEFAVHHPVYAGLMTITVTLEDA